MSEENQNRRRFYRVNDKVSLNYRLVPSADIDREINKANRRQREMSELRNATHALDARIEVLTNKLAQDNPLIGETLNLFHRKIALHERMLGMDDYDDGAFSQAKEINLSASGIAFDADTPLSKDTYIKIELVTYPEHDYIPVYARVIQCNQIEDDSLAGFRIAVEFKGISEEDEARIVNHIFRLQAREIKREKAELKGETLSKSDVSAA
ncbi:MAG: hypothetical protein GKR93_13305 [Gammaproteobacteria bacterium]|nr:hypothetical protein [Gammaproteobacteria bacterium]